MASYYNLGVITCYCYRLYTLNMTEIFTYLSQLFIPFKCIKVRNISSYYYYFFLSQLSFKASKTRFYSCDKLIVLFYIYMYIVLYSNKFSILISRLILQSVRNSYNILYTVLMCKMTDYDKYLHNSNIHFDRE